MLVKFSTLAGGVFIEYAVARTDNPRCFRFDKAGNSEYAYFDDLNSTSPAPRWYGHQFKEKDFVFA